jgi:hypothetical protein
MSDKHTSSDFSTRSNESKCSPDPGKRCDLGFKTDVRKDQPKAQEYLYDI